MKKVNVLPTGYLLVDDYDKGELETLSIGDYGKHHNVKADFLGYSRPIQGVPNTECMPLSEKWVITLSTQYGCPMKCNFCDVPNVKFKGNATFNDLWKQLTNAIALFPDIHYTERLNIHFARMGEPILNKEVFAFAKWLYKNKQTLYNYSKLRVETLHPVLTTSLPKKFKGLERAIHDWIEIKNEVYNGQAGLQFSINSTDSDQREKMFGGQSVDLEYLARMAEDFPSPVSRKYCLNFAYSTDFIVNPTVIAELFNPEKFMIKITPIHNNTACRENGIETIGGYSSYAPYQDLEEGFKAEGFDTLVFIPSLDEEDGLVTCGNAVLGGSQFNLEEGNTKLKIVGVN